MTPDSLADLQALVNRLRRDGGAVRAGATAAGIEAMAGRLAERFGVVVPDDHRAFLGITDGLGWNGLYLYGTTPCRLTGAEEGEADCPDLEQANAARREYKPLDGLLLVGEVDDDFLAYDGAAGCYATLDRVSLDRFETFATLPDMVAAVVASLSDGD